MDLFTLEISRDWLTPIGVALVLLSFYWFRVAYRRSSDVQWRINEEFGYVMRRVYNDHEVAARLSKTEDGAIRLHARSYWQADCEDGTSIKTSVTDSDGSPFTLRCFESDWGNYLRYAT